MLPGNKLQLRPPQRVRNHFIVEFIAENSVRRRVADGSTLIAGAQSVKLGDVVWTWSFDPAKDAKMLAADRFPLSVQRYISVDQVKQMLCRAAFIVGDQSLIVQSELVDYARLAFGKKVSCGS